jgi:peptidoglycan/xylan/chitin deacetylase (PgdA/CDA1 family)
VKAILTYHSIDTSGSAISVSPDVFAEHVRWLSERHVAVMSLGSLLDADAGSSADAVALTFDDGFQNFAAPAALLSDRGLPATLFVVTGHVGGTNAWGGRTDAGIPTLPLLGWGALEQLVARGVAIGAHTRTHARLTALPPAAIEDELDGCSAELRARLGVTASHLAYPYGAVNDDVAAAAKTRFAAAVTTRFAALGATDRRMWIPRLDMYYFRQSGALERWGTPGFARRIWAVRARRRLREAIA